MYVVGLTIIKHLHCSTYSKRCSFHVMRLHAIPVTSAFPNHVIYLHLEIHKLVPGQSRPSLAENQPRKLCLLNSFVSL